jgi:hypothetical protein
VTEQVEACQQREAERRQLHHLFMTAPTTVVILDVPDLVFQLVNPAYQRVFPGRMLSGKPLLEALLESTPQHLSLKIYGAFVRWAKPLWLANCWCS